MPSQERWGRECQSDEWWEHNEPFTRVSSRIEPAYLFNLRERAEFPRFREKKKSFDYLPLGEVLSVSQLIKSREIVMPPSLFDRLPEELITKILDMIFEESDDYPEGAHYFLEYQIFKRDPENYHGCFEIEFLV